MQKIIAISLVLTITACAETQQAVDGVARDAAKAAVDEALVTRFPGVPKQSVTPFSDCIIDNASAREIGTLAKDAVVGTSETTVSIVQGILNRSETQSCVAKATLASFGG